MFAQYRLIGYAIGLAIVIGAIWLHIAGDRRTNDKLSAAIAEVTVIKEELRIVQENFVKATEDKAALDLAKQQADNSRKVLRTERDAALAKLRKQKPPVGCSAAVDWAIQNKGDLSWEK